MKTQRFIGRSLFVISSQKIKQRIQIVPRDCRVSILLIKNDLCLNIIIYNLKKSTRFILAFYTAMMWLQYHNMRVEWHPSAVRTILTSYQDIFFFTKISPMMKPPIFGIIIAINRAQFIHAILTSEYAPRNWDMHCAENNSLRHLTRTASAEILNEFVQNCSQVLTTRLYVLWRSRLTTHDWR